MAMQTQQSNLAAKFGARIAAANEQHKDAPIDSGFQRLPEGLDNAIAKLVSMDFGVYKEEKSGLKGQEFFRAAAVVMLPKEFNGLKLAGAIQTSQIVPMCDTPAKGKKEAKSFEQNFYDFQNIFKICGVPPCPETKSSDPTGAKTIAYFMAAMKGLVDPVRMKTNPVYIAFSTRGWTPPVTPQQPKPDRMVFETWHGPAVYSEQHNPAAGITVAAPTSNGQHSSSPPELAADGLPLTPPVGQPDPVGDEGTVGMPGDGIDENDVDTLLAIATEDPSGETDEGRWATARLEELAWNAGWTKEQTIAAPSWSHLAEMAVNGPVPNDTPSVTVGMKAKFAKRDGKGEKLKNTRTGVEFAPLEVEVVTVDASAQTCTVKDTKTGKDVVNLQTKQPVQVKFEWIE